MILGNILLRVKKCNSYREFIYSDSNSQHVAMMLEPLQEIPPVEDPESPFEIHKVTQFFMVVEGEIAVSTRFSSGEVRQTTVKEGGTVVIPPNTLHNVINTFPGRTRLYTIYTPRQHYT